MKVLIWADDPDLALPVRTTLREGGHNVMIRDARAFAGFGDIERCDALAFVSASKRAMIITEYRSPAAQERYGQVQVFDVETGKFGEPIGMPEIAPVPVEAKDPTESDLLNNRTDRLTDEDLRTFVRVKTGVAPAEDASREDLEAALRQTGPGAPAPTDAEQDEIKRRVRAITAADPETNPEGSKEPPAPQTETTTEAPPPPPATPEPKAEGPTRRKRGQTQG